jgi:glycosyltransferase involved in cell wall biosynthesis
MPGTTLQFTVLIPTHKRPVELAAAIESALRQTVPPAEIVVVDDDPYGQEGFAVAERFRKAGKPVRGVLNEGLHGQSANTNVGLRACRTDWIKILHDDDLLLPECLERFTMAARLAPDALAIRCRCHDVAHGRRSRTFTRQPGVPLMLRLDPPETLVSMYLNDNGAGGVPTLLAVSRRVVDADISFEEHGGLWHMVDSYWAARIAARGPWVVINEGLAERYQGDTVSVTSQTSDAIFDAELPILRELIYSLMPADVRERVPAVSRMNAAYRVIRGFRGLSHRKFLYALPKLLGILDPRVCDIAFALRRRIDGERQAPEIAKWTVLEVPQSPTGLNDAQICDLA